MPGMRRRRLREQAAEARLKADALAAAGDPGAAEAKTYADALADLAGRKYASSSQVPVIPVPGEPDEPPAGLPPRPSPNRAARDRKMKAVRLVGPQAAAMDEICEPGSLASEAGTLAAEIAVAGVRPGFAIADLAAPPEPLTDGEFDVARAVVLAAGDEEGSSLAESGAPRDLWLANAFPTLSPADRVRCSRFLCVMASNAAEAPSPGDGGRTVAERALAASGMSYVSFVAACRRESQFDSAQKAVAAARKHAVMNLLEETLWRRAIHGQEDESLARDGSVVSLLKHDNNLAFNLLKYGHEEYARQMVKQQSAASAMTLMISGGCMPSVPVMKRAEAIEATEVKPRG